MTPRSSRESSYRPLFIFDVHYACNQTCAYCVSGSSPRNAFGPAWEPEQTAKLLRFFERYGPFRIVFTGGEPLITPGIFDFFRALTAQGHHIALQSNLKVNADRFAEAVPVEACAYVMTSFHSVELKRWRRYVEHVTLLKDRGYPLAVKLVLDDALLPTFADLFDELRDKGIGVFLSPLMHFPPKAEPHPHQYALADWARIIPRMTLKSSWLYFAGGFRSRGTLCGAGSKLFYSHTVQGGDIGGCGHAFPGRGLGNTFAGEMRAFDQPVTCGLDLCVCDFHYYTGVIEGLDDSDGFASLTRGRSELVSFEDYQQWIAQAGIKPVIDLAPVISAAGSTCGLKRSA